MIEEIEIYKIGDFPNHPFRVRYDEEMLKLTKSIIEYGVLLTVIVRSRGEENYQMISGHLVPKLLDLVDSKIIVFGPAVELSYLSEKNQYAVESICEFDEITPSLSQAIKLKKLEQEGILTEEKIEEIMGQIKPNQKEYIKIQNEKIEKYIPSRIKEAGKTEEFIIKRVKEYIEREMIKRQKMGRRT